MYTKSKEPDPCKILCVKSDWQLADIKLVWEKLGRENHPDKFIANGLPIEAVELANQRLLTINKAWQAIRKEDN